jgi:HD-like signal output (HDOD) protein
MSDKKKILFVDDERNILEALHRMLRSMRQEWDMTFAGSGQEALDILAKKPFDLIVSDIRMPGIDGVQLLEEAKRQYPHIARIALSGQTSKESILRSVGPIHQYLSKPCDMETLKTTITRVCALRNLLSNKKLQSLISQLESLPCMSSLYTKLIEELESEDASIKRVGEVISQDVGMSVKILQLVNSAFFGIRQHVSSIPQAVSLLGLEIIKALVLSTKIFSQFTDMPLEKFSYTTFMEHSFAVSEWARLIARAENMDEKLIDYTMVAGMLHDVGKLILAAKIPLEYAKVLSLTESKEITLIEAEKEVIGSTHAQVGAYLLGLWGFSNPIMEALAFHHQPAEAPKKEFSVLTAVYAANILIHEIRPVAYNKKGNLQIDENYLEELGLSDRLSVWMKACPERLKATCQI